MKTEFSNRLGKLRREKGFSQRQAASQFGISQALLSHYENGAREPKFEFVLQACEFYTVTADYLLGRTAERKSEAEVLSNKISGVINTLDELRSKEANIIGELKEIIGKDKLNNARENP